VLGLSWNALQTNMLASASADKTVKLWDLNTGTCVKTYTYHTNKVQSVIWNPSEAAILASGGFDGNLIITDVRAPNNANVTVHFDADVEAIAWLPAPHHNFVVVSSDDGFVYCFDILKQISLQAPVWKLQAHEKSTQAMSVSSVPRGDGTKGIMLATGSTEKASPLKIWDISENQPTCLYSKTSDIGAVYSLKFAESDPYVLAVGSKTEQPHVINTLNFPGVSLKCNSPNTEIKPPTTQDEIMNLETVLKNASEKIKKAENSDQNKTTPNKHRKKKKKKTRK